MSDIALSILIKPLVLLVLFGLAAICAWAIGKLIPSGRVKTWLYRKRELSDWPMIIGWLGGFALLMLFIGWLGRDVI